MHNEKKMKDYYPFIPLFLKKHSNIYKTLHKLSSKKVGTLFCLSI